MRYDQHRQPGKPLRLARLLATDRAHTPQPWRAPFLDDPKLTGPLDREALAWVIDRCRQLPAEITGREIGVHEIVGNSDTRLWSRLSGWV